MALINSITTLFSRLGWRSSKCRSVGWKTWASPSVRHISSTVLTIHTLGHRNDVTVTFSSHMPFHETDVQLEMTQVSREGSVRLMWYSRGWEHIDHMDRALIGPLSTGLVQSNRRCLECYAILFASPGFYYMISIIFQVFRIQHFTGNEYKETLYTTRR